MVAPEPTRGDRRPRGGLEADAERNTLSTYLEFLLGGLLVTVGFAVSFPALIDLTHGFGVLSTTALVFLFIFAWYVAWVGICVTYPRLKRWVGHA
ncbi:hypothetical protein [Halobellus rufus]|uniref:hypothetical protein n=1 Tax=Halobellus rufus TaxID=1448860 RepID=UPI0012E035DF|nr:hypothetical protein [Halobellus rufus]